MHFARRERRSLTPLSSAELFLLECESSVRLSRMPRIVGAYEVLRVPTDEGNFGEVARDRPLVQEDKHAENRHGDSFA